MRIDFKNLEQELRKRGKGRHKHHITIPVVMEVVRKLKVVKKKK